MPTWNNIYSLTPTNATGSDIGPPLTASGLQDQSASWKIDVNGKIRPVNGEKFNNHVLMVPQSNNQDQRVTIRFSGCTDSIFLTLHSSYNSGAGEYQYWCMGIGGGGAAALFRQFGGLANQGVDNGATYSLDPATTYDLQYSLIGTLHTLKLFAVPNSSAELASGSVLLTATSNRAVDAPTTGTAGVFPYFQIPLISRISSDVYSEASALSPGTATATPGNSSVALTLSGTSGGTSPYSYQWYRSTTSGQQGSALAGATTASYTDSAAVNGTTYYYQCIVTDSASVTATSNQASATPIAPGVVVYVNDPKIFFPKLGYFYDGSANSGNGVIQTVNSGNIVKLKYTSTGNGNIVANIDGATNSNLKLAVKIDTGSWTLVPTTSGSGSVTLASNIAAGTHDVSVMVSTFESTNSRWGNNGSPSNSFRLFGFTLPSGSSLQNPTVKSKRGIVYGDSISEGKQSGGLATHDASVAYPVRLADLLNAEFAVIGFGGSGYQVGGEDQIPAFPSNWNKYESQHNRVDGSGVYVDAVDYVVILHGTNDRGYPQNTEKTLVQNLLPSLRTAAGTARIYQCVPFGNTNGTIFCQTAITNAVADYKTSAPSDDKTNLVDISLSKSNEIEAQCPDQIHPNPAGHILLADHIYGGILASMPASFTITPTTSGSNINLALTGTNTNWTSGTTFTVTGGTGASLSNKVVSSGTAATVTLNPGTASANLTISDGTASATLVVAVSGGSGGTGPTAQEIALAVWDMANGIESNETPRQTMRLLRAVMAGKATESAGNWSAKRKDGTTTAVTITHDANGNRTASTPGGLS